MPDMEKVIKDFEAYETYALNLPSITMISKHYLDALELLKEQEAENSKISNAYLELVGKASKQPQIVRCKDCKYRSEEMYDYYHNPNDKRYVCQINDLAKKPDWFCADGKRRKDDG